MTRQNFGSGAPWEAKVCYSRAVRVGDMVFVSGTTAVDGEGRVVGEGDAGAQAVFIFKKIEDALVQAGAALKDVVRTRMFVCDIGDWEAIGAAHAGAFEGVNPAATMVEVSRLIDDRLLVEIEVDAVVSQA